MPELEHEIKELVNNEIDRFKLEADNRMIRMEGLVREATQCTEAVKLLHEQAIGKIDDMGNKFSVIKRWLLGTNGNSISEDEIKDSFVVRFREIEKFVRAYQPWHIKIGAWVKANPKTAIGAGILILNALGFSSVGIMNFLQKIAAIAAQLETVVPK